MTGNTDYDPQDLVDIGDVTRMIDYLFVSMEPLYCPEEGNVDGSEGGVVDMGDLTALISYLFIPPHTPLAPCQ
ncbi:MAG: hypothetical protein JSU65_06300 [Candidatus Zixiibacteriota bacterium]|nr:MAG: hypothetical protein JSU65_06300 [candidate division Zixibacteria bacterium]